VHRGRLIVIAGPSGVGKGSIVQRLLSRDPGGLAYSVSVKTRDPRPGEVHGREYFFVDEPEFDRMIEAGELLEWAPFTDHRSGTPRGFVEQTVAQGRDVVLELDVEGARQIKERVPDALLIFIRPPSFAELEARLRGRGTEDEARIATRLATATREMEQAGWFDHVVTNDDLARATDEVAAIIESSHTL
jgi:guanylate kinase